MAKVGGKCMKQFPILINDCLRRYNLEIEPHNAISLLLNLHSLNC